MKELKRLAMRLEHPFKVINNHNSAYGLARGRAHFNNHCF